MEGLLSFAAAGGIYKWGPCIAPMLGTSIPSLVSAITLVWGFNAFAQRNYVDYIKIIEDGQNKGKVEISVAYTLLQRAKFICSPEDIER